jgi:hypothetical protein
MKRIFISIFFIIATTLIFAQNDFTDKIHQTKAGEGKVTLHQSSKLNALVNGKTVAPAAKSVAPKTVKKEEPAPKKSIAKEQDQSKSAHSTEHAKKQVKSNESKSVSEESRKHSVSTSRKSTSETDVKSRQKGDSGRTHAPAKTEERSTATQVDNEDEPEDTPPDLSIKTYRRRIKVNGYRVQVYAGGNSRTSHQEAERMTALVKEYFPDQPVYTHFYNPRWICRVGNFRSYEEANRMLRQMKATRLFREAAIIKCQIQIAL